MDFALVEKLGLSPVQKEVLKILERAARNRTTITYGELGTIIDMETKDVGCFLKPLQEKLNSIGYPPLNYLVVNKQSGIPGYNVNAPHGYKLIDPLKAKEEVYQYFAQNF